MKNAKLVTQLYNSHTATKSKARRLCRQAADAIQALERGKGRMQYGGVRSNPGTDATLLMTMREAFKPSSADQCAEIAELEMFKLPTDPTPNEKTIQLEFYKLIQPLARIVGEQNRHLQELNDAVHGNSKYTTYVHRRVTALTSRVAALEEQPPVIPETESSPAAKSDIAGLIEEIGDHKTHWLDQAHRHFASGYTDRCYHLVALLTRCRTELENSEDWRKTKYCIEYWERQAKSYEQDRDKLKEEVVEQTRIKDYWAERSHKHAMEIYALRAKIDEAVTVIELSGPVPLEKIDTRVVLANLLAILTRDAKKEPCKATKMAADPIATILQKCNELIPSDDGWNLSREIIDIVLAQQKEELAIPSPFQIPDELRSVVKETDTINGVTREALVKFGFPIGQAEWREFKQQVAEK